MLDAIADYVKDLAYVVSTVTEIDIEVVDRNLVRIAGTGIYADSVGDSITQAGALYTHALATAEPLYVDNPKENPLCFQCPNLDHCQEKLTLCSPIVADGEILGIIGLVCFNDDDRLKVQANRDIYIRFVQQIAETLARVATNERRSRENSRRLSTLLEITDANSRGVLVLGRDGRVTFVNDNARKELGITDGEEAGYSVTVAATGDVYSDMEEYAVIVSATASVTDGDAPALVDRDEHVVLGKFLQLDRQDDPAFDRALVFESRARLTAMLSRLGGSGGHGGVLGAIIGSGPIMLNLKKRVGQVANTSSTVLITGESGTGKEMFARAIHDSGPRRDKPFVAINCGAIPDALLESELFGYAQGAFTSADPSGRMGKIELADQGVLFLDEIGSMPLHLQVKLLRVLQERTFSRLGSNTTIKVDIRVIAATNEKLTSLIEQRMFREDLYYRLNVIPLEIPPLRERKKDIPELAEYFLDRYCRLFSKPPLRLSPSLLDIFTAYSWPGNIRELENCVEYMVNMHDGGPLSTRALPAKLAALASVPLPSVRPAIPQADEPVTAPIVPIARLEQEAIQNALRHFGDSADGKRRAAEALGIGIATLYRKIRPSDPK
ncbi:MAG: sigma 54-interacting transcriptional regulator [Planctomycetes bacterium]|nr:sigma 54-interacting transcriptional regulator [Planctomycetota bacterium]